jgi:DNA-directed RNA polymerase sigma subunit (sigma70/sigma32)
MWEQWNGELKNPEFPALLREHTRLNAAITHEYTDLLMIAIKDSHWFQQTQEVIFTESFEYKQQWLESALSARECYIRHHRHRTKLHRQHTAMHIYLHPQP